LNKGVWIDAGDGGGPWLNTGDLGRQDADGYFWITGRSKELIIRGGHNIDPRLIEDALHLHPSVALAAAVGRPDAHSGELPVVYVQLKPGASATSEELMTFAAENVGERAAVPKAVHILETMPLTAVGKIFKPQLIWRETETVLTEELKKVEGVTECEVKVGPDSHFGKTAQLRLVRDPSSDQNTVESAAREALSKYAIHYDLKLEA
jgi:fatty-acyl-CoA synthase